MSKELFKSVYRSIRRHSKILDKNGGNKCFLMAKPNQIFLRNSENSATVKLNENDYEMIETIINDYNRGEYYKPSNKNELKRSFSTLITNVYRYSIPKRYRLGNYNNNVNNLQYNLQLSFYVLKRLSHATNMIKQISNNNNNVSNDKIELNLDLSSIVLQNNINNLEKGLVLITHPMACIGHNELNKRVIYIIESDKNERVIGIVMNYAFNKFDAIYNKQENSKVKDSFMGFKNEYVYYGGPVNDNRFPFCIMYNSETFYKKFKSFSTVIKDGLYWTWVSNENYDKIYNELNIISNALLNKDNITTDNNNETTNTNESNNDNSNINEYKDVIHDISFRFFKNFAIWSYNQLKIELTNNVWFPVRFTNPEQELQFLNKKCENINKSTFNRDVWKSFVKQLNGEYNDLINFPNFTEQMIQNHYEFVNDFHNKFTISKDKKTDNDIVIEIDDDNENNNSDDSDNNEDESEYDTQKK